MDYFFFFGFTGWLLFGGATHQTIHDPKPPSGIFDLMLFALLILSSSESLSDEVSRSSIFFSFLLRFSLSSFFFSTLGGSCSYSSLPRPSTTRLWGTYLAPSPKRRALASKTGCFGFSSVPVDSPSHESTMSSASCFNSTCLSSLMGGILHVGEQIVEKDGGPKKDETCSLAVVIHRKMYCPCNG